MIEGIYSYTGFDWGSPYVQVRTGQAQMCRRALRTVATTELEHAQRIAE